MPTGLPEVVAVVHNGPGPRLQTFRMHLSYSHKALADRVPVDPRVRWNINGRNEAQCEPIEGFGYRESFLNVDFCSPDSLRPMQAGERVGESRQVLGTAGDHVVEDPVASRHWIPGLREHAGIGEINPSARSLHKPDRVRPESRT